MVHGTIDHCNDGRNTSIRFNLYRNVFHLYLVLGLSQDLLCVRVYDVGLPNIDRRYRLRYHRLYLFPFECRRLSMVSFIEFN